MILNSKSVNTNFSPGMMAGADDNLSNDQGATMLAPADYFLTRKGFYGVVKMASFYIGTNIT